MYQVDNAIRGCKDDDERVEVTRSIRELMTKKWWRLSRRVEASARRLGFLYLPVQSGPPFRFLFLLTVQFVSQELEGCRRGYLSGMLGPDCYLCYARYFYCSDKS